MDRLADGWNVDMVYLDFPKAYDMVDHSQLLKKMKFKEIGGVLLQWLQEYQVRRFHSVRKK